MGLPLIGNLCANAIGATPHRTVPPGGLNARRDIHVEVIVDYQIILRVAFACFTVDGRVAAGYKMDKVSKK